jgi:uncharacterized membrane protein YhhN
MLNLLIVLTAIILLTVLLHYENRQNIQGLLSAKALLSSLFILAVLVQPHPITHYYHFLLSGLLLCLLGDICLAFQQEKMSLWGLISFLLGHIFYIFGFFYVAQLGAWTWGGSIIVLCISSRIYFWLKPHLGTMKTPVLLYCIVITVMLSGAWSVLDNSRLMLSGRRMVFIGAFLFYISDVFVARDRFLKKEFFNRLVGLPLYYTGQFTLAFSVGILE